jgi:hypothetical protein
MRWKDNDNGPHRGDERIVKHFTVLPYQLDMWSENIWMETIYIKQKYYCEMDEVDFRIGWEDQWLTTKEEYDKFKGNGKQV